MKNSLRTLSRIQKFQIDEQRKLLNEQLEKEEQLEKQLADMAAELEREKAFAGENLQVGDFGSYMKRHIERREKLENMLAGVRRRIEEIRDVISDMFKERKTYEIVDRNRQERALKEEEGKMQKTLDEIGTNNYIKHHKNK